MRVEKGTDFVEITDGLSVDQNGGEVWFISSSLDPHVLPDQFHAQVQKTDTEGYQKLEEAVLSWARRNEYAVITNPSA
ncbi:MAG: hypothetical protein WC047_07450 [Kiritimatiellales bacterium]